MSQPSTDDPRYKLASILAPPQLARLGAIGATLIAATAAFAWTGGYFSPNRLDQSRMIDAFEADNGVHPGFRRNHAKGVCVDGTFDSNGAGARVSKAQVFQPGRVPVFGRFALSGGVPMVADAPTIVRSLALNFSLPDGEAWRTAMINIPVFPLKDPRAFYEQLVASRPDPKTGHPDPQALAAFVAHHPETAQAMAIIHARGFSSAFANATYNALNAFLFTSAAGVATPVRWSAEPVDAFVPAPTAADGDQNYLFESLIARVQEAPAQWHLILTIGQPGDPTDDATLPWPADRERIDAGTLSVTHITAESDGNCRDVNFDPLVLPDGIAPSDDPLLSARSAAYSTSFTRRAGEPKTPSAIQTTNQPATSQTATRP
ncbi:catalase [Enhydrobacter aerosaccus]|uniref:Catalase-related peroxidase n=1 Tax=Enhydrobacter aerosaccus TaxID=225324 RepID=A0A1T4P2V5_9HYPH|nr:catalase family peroxidase [Enhydrobacter aerosaccus]SJZ85833.1 catalase [Enhydrobacter aerosaccus]